jgi:hypothetical protein
MIKKVTGKALTGYCGLNCNYCPVFIATKTNNEQLKEKIAREWSLFYVEHIGIELTANNIHCNGCKANSKGCFIGCIHCVIRHCCSSKKYNTCAECNKYEKCRIINRFFSTNETAKVTLDHLKKNRLN